MAAALGEEISFDQNQTRVFEKHFYLKKSEVFRLLNGNGRELFLDREQLFHKTVEVLNIEKSLKQALEGSAKARSKRNER